MSDNYTAVNEDLAANWKEIISAYSDAVEDSSYHSKCPISTLDFSLPDDVSSILMAIADGSDKRLSILLITLAACAQATMSYSSKLTLLTSNYVEDEDVAKIICLPVHSRPECSLKEMVMTTSDNMQQQLSYGVEKLEKLFDYPTIFALAVSLQGCQHMPDDFCQHSLMNMIFRCDEGKISCKVSSRLGEDYSTALMRLVQDWASQIRSPSAISQLSIPEPFLFCEKERQSDWVGEKSILDLFQRQVELHPHRIAVACDTTQLSYSQLDILSTNGAIHLQAAGIRQGDSIGIHMPRRCSAIVAIFAALKAGGRYCPFDIAWPDNRKQHVLNGADIRLTLVDTDTQLKLDGHRQMFYDELQSVPESGTKHILPSLNGQDSAYIIFTSGSTGEPKGVEVSHSAVVNLVSGLKDKIYRHFPDELNIALTAALSFDVSVQQSYPALLLGHTLHLIPDDIRKDGSRIIRFWQEKKIDIADCTPTHLRIICLKMKGPRKPFPVRHLLVSAEKLEYRTWQAFAECWDSIPSASNAYGPTECCVQSLSFEFNSDTLITTPSVPIGTPMLGEEIVLLDTSLRILPRGALGEIAIAGKGVAKGYINSAELTQKSFIRIGDKRYYRTGDLAKYIGEEGLLYIARVDSQVKINGYRIELREVEIVLQKTLLEYRQSECSEKMADVYVMVNTSDADNPILVAYICSNIQFDPYELRRAVAKHLPNYMVPAYFVAVSQFAQNSNGKIDPTGLPDPRDEILKGSILTCYGDTEKKIRDVWSELLGRRKEDIHPDMSFFDLGGTSFKLAQLSIRLSDMFAREVEVVDLFKYTTIALQANYIDNNAIGNIDSPEIGDSVEQFDNALKIFGP